MQALNEIVRERVTRGGAIYVDVWEAFANEQGQYAAIGPDVNGEICAASHDGRGAFHEGRREEAGLFRRPRNRPAIAARAHTGLEIAAVPPVSPGPADGAPPAAPAPVAPLPNPGSITLAPVPADLPAVVIIRERPLQGPAVSLTAAPQTPGGLLYRAPPVPIMNEERIMVEKGAGLRASRLPRSRVGRMMPAGLGNSPLIDTAFQRNRRNTDHTTGSPCHGRSLSRQQRRAHQEFIDGTGRLPPSRIAQTTRLWPRRMSPATKTFSIDVL